MKTTAKFATLLNQLLASRERSAAWLAKKVTVDRGTVSRWTNGQTLPASADTVLAVAEALEADRALQQALLNAAGFTAYTNGAAKPPNGAVTQPIFALPNDLQLPAYPDPFVGRSAEIAWLLTLLTDGKTRLVTICGPGGIGKSRLALEIGRQLQAHFDEVHLIPFSKDSADLTGRQLMPRLADALKLRFDEGVPTKSQLIHALDPKKAPTHFRQL